ncbi:MAG TPA: outer membrane beta-barrel protein [Bryocella sp.]|nr:outer membrane beta-barrel protein [Bryocella sp.]
MMSSAARNCCLSLLAIFGLLILPDAAKAQAGVYGMLSAGHYSGLGVGYGTASNQSGGMTADGGTFGVYDNFMPFGPVRFGGDARVIIQNSANSTQYGNKLAGFLFGPRLEIAPPPPIPVKPYIQLEFGGVGTNNGSSHSKSTSFAYQVNGGIDFTVLPHLDIRGEYGAGQLTSIGGTHHTLQEFGVGLVLRM